MAIHVLVTGQRVHHVNLPEGDTPKGEYAMEVRQRVLYASPLRRGLGRVNEHANTNIEFAEVDVALAHDGDHFTVLAAISTRAIAPGDFLHADYGPDYAPVRAFRGYSVERPPGWAPSPLDRHGEHPEAALRAAFSAEELPLLCDVGGILDHTGRPVSVWSRRRRRSRRDRNRYFGGPPPPPAAAPHAPSIASGLHSPPARRRTFHAAGASGSTPPAPPLLHVSR